MSHTYLGTSSLVNKKINVRKAEIADIEIIFKLLSLYAKDRLLLSRTQEDILNRLANFLVVEVDEQLVGCAALRDFGGGLFEVRSLAVDTHWNGYGLGSLLVCRLMDRVRMIPNARIFALTYRAHFFMRIGFSIVNKNMFPEKIWSDCINCDKRENCDEDAVLITF